MNGFGSRAKPDTLLTRERDAAIVRLFPIVRPIALSVSRRLPRVELDDLIGDGCVGLVRAVDTYDPYRGEMTLERYARAIVLGAMLNGIRQMDRLADSTRRVLREAERDLYETAVLCGRLPSSAQMEARHPKLRYARIAARERQAVSLDAGLPIDALLAPNWDADPARIYIAYESGCRLHEALGRLSSRHRQVVELYYYSDCRLKTVALQLAVTKQRVAQLRDDALRRVREEMHSRPSGGTGRRAEPKKPAGAFVGFETVS